MQPVSRYMSIGANPFLCSACLRLLRLDAGGKFVKVKATFIMHLGMEVWNLEKGSPEQGKVKRRGEGRRAMVCDPGRYEYLLITDES